MAITTQNPIAIVELCSTLRQLRQLHGHFLAAGVLLDPPLFAKFVAAVALSPKTPHHLPYSHELLSHSPHHASLFALNSMIRAHSKSSTPIKSFHFYRQILLADALSPDNYTFTFLIRACTQASAPEAGRAAHAAALRRGFLSDSHVQSGLIHMYAELGSSDAFRGIYAELQNPDLVTQTAMVSACAESGEIKLARQLFDEMPHRDVVAWNAMIAGYSHLGRSREALDLFGLMQVEGVRIGEATMVSVLTACAHLGALEQGKWVHVYVEKNKLRLTVTLGTALLDMYFKCGCVARAMDVFWRMKERNVYTWSSAISGLAMNGNGGKCLELFEQMKDDGVLPNEVTFVALLRGCSVAGLVEEGRDVFESMKSRYGIEPWLEHYGCVVDMYGRAGRLKDAISFIDAMPVEPHAGAWGALLNACRLHNNIELGEYAMKKMMQLELRNHGAYVSLSNIYAESRNWHGVSDVRELMKAKGVRKEPGCSVIEVDGQLHEFFVGNKSHPKYINIETTMKEMMSKLRSAGYVSRTNQVLFDIEEEEKEDALCWHSEKLAIAFGLMSLRDGVNIRIVKNLRVCWDCHETSKFVSKVFDREIVMRDRNRFHHFKDGVCSCMDYW
ncbi:putative pentatricopeptide repeat-containing protein At5g40405 [Dioscorea cayenensis subsp. rotundata]|uniref:Pentatricopeptide repeat-containing protein At5g40405 n=1 Tax=Dioscorea cayennensis subsp. rotundata TaxID=55577 RepID=A0AB40AUB4_DIOCR|nr:putative pentatricopeptide repeat-containing protein At5g40405 [Dioscorea cayenensis subsp. rotundata]